MRTRRWIFAILIVEGSLLVSALTVSAQEFRTGVEQLAAQIAKAAPEGKQLRVAVADFPDLQGVVSEFGRYIASRLTTRLADIKEKEKGSPPKFVIFGETPVESPSKEV